MADDLKPVAGNRTAVDLRLYTDAEGRPVLRIICDCSIITDAVLEIHALGEFAITCDGCQTSRWFALGAPGVAS